MKKLNALKISGWILAPLSFILFAAINPFGVSAHAAITLAIASVMIIFWITEVVEMPVVALFPLFFFPLLGIRSIRETAAAYGDPAIFLFLGGFLIGLAIEKWNLHKRIALTIVNLTGTSGDRIILGFILATGLLSMWLSNTATTMMMYPIAASVIGVISENRKEGQMQDPGKRGANIPNFALAIMLSIAYASNFGGVATLIGTPPNVAFSGYMSDRGYDIGFAEWMKFGMPLALGMMVCLYFVLTRVMHPSRIKSDKLTAIHIRNELQALGPMSVSEKRVLAVFTATALCWITRDLINSLGFFKLDDTMIAVGGACLLFFIPSGAKDRQDDRALLHWKDTSRVAWGILLLFGGGIALAGALEDAGLIERLGKWISGYAGSNLLLLIITITLVSLFISELMSNIAQVIVFAPVVGGMADALGINPLVLGIPMTLAASCASMLPMGTPPNAIVFASGHVPMRKMVQTGFVMNLVAAVLISFICWLLLV